MQVVKRDVLYLWLYLLNRTPGKLRSDIFCLQTTMSYARKLYARTIITRE